MSRFNPIAFLSVVFLSGCFVDRTLTLKPRFSSLVGHTFITKVDLAAFRYRDRKNQIFLDQFGAHNGEIPSREKIKEGPYKYGDYIIEGVFPAGSRFRVVRIVEENSFENSLLGIFATVVESGSGKMIGKEVNLLWLMVDIYSKPTLEFKSDLVGPIAK